VEAQARAAPAFQQLPPRRRTGRSSVGDGRVGRGSRDPVLSELRCLTGAAGSGPVLLGPRGSGSPDLRADLDPAGERERAPFRLHLVRHRSSLKNRIHAILLPTPHPNASSDLFGAGGRQLLERLALPEPWASTVRASLALIDTSTS